MRLYDFDFMWDRISDPVMRSDAPLRPCCDLRGLSEFGLCLHDQRVQFVALLSNTRK